MNNKSFLSVLILLSVFALPDIFAAGDTAVYRKNANYEYELGLYKVYKKKRANVVMLGNSITHGVNWNELTGREDIVERGIPADILEGMHARLQYVLELKPKVVFIMGGINDIYSWIPVDTIFKYYTGIIEVLQKEKIKVVVQSTLYAAAKYRNSKDRNPVVAELNQRLKEYCKSKYIEYLDLNSLLSKEKFLRDECTHDGLHLNAAGYRIWGREVEQLLFKFAI